MTRTNARLAVAAMATLAVAVPASSASAATVNYTTKLSSATLTTGNGYPNPGGTALLAGSIKAKPFGAGALVSRVKTTGHPEPNVFEFKGKETDFYAHGTQRASFTGTSTIDEDGTQNVVVNGTFTGGTGRYREATGHFTFKGTVAGGSTVLNGTSSGRVKTPGASSSRSSSMDLSGTRYAPAGYFYTHSPEAGGGWADLAEAQHRAR